MQQSMWGVDDDLKVVRIDISPEDPDRFRKAAVALIGDAADCAAALLERVPTYNTKRSRRDDELARHRHWLAERLSRLEPQIGFLNAMRSALPHSGTFVDEVTQVAFASPLAFPYYHPRTHPSPGYQDNLGWGLGTALGVKAVRPDAPVLAITGHGGALYQIGELATAVQHNLSIVLVAFDHSMFGNVRRIQEEKYGNRVIAADLADPDSVKLADAVRRLKFSRNDAR